MKVSIIAATLVAFAYAAPMASPQDFDGDFIDSIPAPTDLGAPAGATKSGPDVNVDALVDSAVSQLDDKKKMKKRSVSSDNFVKVFDDWTGSTQTGGFLTFKVLTTYDVDLCATKCLANTGCNFFNIFEETSWTGVTIKCSLYSIPSTKASATNFGGQVRNGVVTSKAKSAGYKKKGGPPDLEGYTYECFPGASIKAPSGTTTYMGVSFKTNDPAVCAAACEEKSSYNEDQANPGDTYRVCNFFNYYQVFQDGVPYQTACTFYLVPYDSSFATNTGQTRNGHVYSIGDSCGYTRKTLVGVDGIATKEGGIVEAKIN